MTSAAAAQRSPFPRPNGFCARRCKWPVTFRCRRRGNGSRVEAELRILATLSSTPNAPANLSAAHPEGAGLIDILETSASRRMAHPFPRWVSEHQACAATFPLSATRSATSILESGKESRKARSSGVRPQQTRPRLLRPAHLGCPGLTALSTRRRTSSLFCSAVIGNPHFSVHGSHQAQARLAGAAAVAMINPPGWPLRPYAGGGTSGVSHAARTAGR